MSTRSMINRKNKEGNYEAIYCHSDGYLEGVGKVLFENYQTNEKIDQLFKNGDISTLGKSTEKPEGHSFDNRIEGYTVFYHRDRGEKLEAPNVSKEPMMQATGYIWEDGKWSMLEYSYEKDGEVKLVSLESALKEKGLI